MLSSLNKNLNSNVVGNVVLLNQLTANLVLGLRRARKSNLDFLKAHIAQRVEELQLFLKVHRVNKRLVSVAEIHAAPNRSLVNDLVRPCSVGNVNLLKGNVLFK